MINIAAYLRMSGERQDKSIEDQRTECTTYAKKHRYKIVAWYTDEAISGWKSKERRGFHQLIADAQAGTFKGVLCWDQSRFSRFDPMEANYFWHILRTAGVFLETVKEGRIDWDSLGGWLTASVQQHGKAEYVRSLAADSVRGKRARVAAGKWTSRAPYGYRIGDTGRLVVEPEKAAVVKRIFEMRAKNLGRKAICVALMADGIPAPQGGIWRTCTVKLMLNCETYLGRMVVGKLADGKFCRISEGVQTFDDMHPPIVSRELWERVRKIDKQRENGGGLRTGKRTGAPLSGLAFCGNCGAVLLAQRSRGTYICSTNHTGRGCSHNQVQYTRIHAAVAEVVRQVVLKGSPERLTAHIEKILSRRSSKVTDSAAVKRQIADLDRKLSVAADRLLEVESSLVKNVRNAMLSLQERRQTLQLKLAAESPKATASAQEIAERAWRIDATLQRMEPIAARALLREIFSRIVVEYAKRGKTWRAVALLLSFVPIGDSLSKRAIPNWALPNRTLRVELPD